VSLEAEERESADFGFAAEHTLPVSLDRFTFSEERLMLVMTPRSWERGCLAGPSR
jgi:hypothetical protein